MRVRAYGMRWVAIALVAVLLGGLTALVTAGGQAEPAVAQVTVDKQGRNAVSVGSGGITVAAVKDDGRLYVRTAGIRGSVVTWGPWIKLGTADNWVAVDLITDSRHNVFVVAVKDTGALYTRMGTLVFGGAFTYEWDSWVKHGASTWSTSASPSIDAKTSNGAGTLVFGAVKDDGRFYTRQFNLASASEGSVEGTWDGFKRHGLAGWASVDISLGGPSSAGHVEIWLVGVKTDGRLYTRVRPIQTTEWDGFVRHGAPTWDPSSPPSIDSSWNYDTIFSAVKADGRLYTRKLKTGIGWDTFVQQGRGGWSAADIEITPWYAHLVAVKDNGALYSHRFDMVSSTWEPWQKQGASTWSTMQPAASNHLRSIQWAFLAVKSDGALYVRYVDDTDWLPFWKLGRSDWETGT